MKKNVNSKKPSTVYMDINNKCICVSRIVIFIFFLFVANDTYGKADYYDFSVNGIYYVKQKSGIEVYVTKEDILKESYKGKVVIPKNVTYNGVTYLVTGIAHGAFRNCKELSNVQIPVSVKEIGIYAFNGCKSLKSIIIPRGIKVLSEGVFQGCGALSSVSLPNSLKEIGKDAFVSCSSLSSIILPKDLEEIGPGAFSGCHSLQSIEIPQKVKSLASAFRFCYSLKSIQLNNSLKRIDEAFGGCESLTSITIPNSVKIIGSGAFRSCTALKSIIIPDSVLLIGPGCFSGCTALKTVKLPNNKYCKINYYAFQDCSSLESITIPQNIVAVGLAFTDCSSLKTIKIYKGATINEKTFFNCPKAKIQWIDDNIPSSSYQNKESNSNKFRLSTTTTEGASKTAVTPAPSTNKTRHKTYTSSTTTTKPSTTTTTTSGFNLKGLVKVGHKNVYNRTAESLQRNVHNFTPYDLMEKIMGVIEKPSNNLDFNTVFSKLRKAYPEMSEISTMYDNYYEFDNLTIRCNNVTAFPEIAFENGKYSKVEYVMFFNNMKEAARFAKQIKADIESHGYSLEVFEEKSNDCHYDLWMEGLHLNIMTITYKYVDTNCYVVKFMTEPFSYKKNK